MTDTSNQDSPTSHVSGEVTAWIGRLKAGDESAFVQLFSEYFPKLVKEARRTLKNRQFGIEDEEDAALSAMRTFYRRFSEDGFSDLEHSGNLWGILKQVATRKAHKIQERAGAKKRGGDAQRDGCDISLFGDQPQDLDLVVFESLEFLKDDGLREIALMRLYGFTTQQIADQLSKSRSTIERKLKLIQDLWSEQG